jgi:hypothetical protein
MLSNVEHKHLNISECRVGWKAVHACLAGVANTAEGCSALLPWSTVQHGALPSVTLRSNSKRRTCHQVQHLKAALQLATAACRNNKQRQAAEAVDSSAATLA